ncbi:MAG: hypothetical protein WCI81_02520 [Chlorobiaceae bacterium]
MPTLRSLVYSCRCSDDDASSVEKRSDVSFMDKCQGGESSVSFAGVRILAVLSSTGAVH